MYSPTLNDAASMTNYPPANHSLNRLTTQMRRATFSIRLLACSAAVVQLMVKRELELGPLPSNRGRDRTQIVSSAMYSKMCVFSLSPSPFRNPRLTIHTHPPAPPTRGRASSPYVDLARCGVWCWSRLHHRQRTRSCYGCICGKSTWSRQRCQGKECGCRVRRIRRGSEGRGA